MKYIEKKNKFTYFWHVNVRKRHVQTTDLRFCLFLVYLQQNYKIAESCDVMQQLE